jgi:two-component sensor histidine kinase
MTAAGIAGALAGTKALPAERVDILLVDDNAENLVALEAVLADLGQNLVTARSGEEALKRLLHQDFAVILMDVQMPEMDGFEAARLIRQRDRSRHTPIVFLTAINKSEMHVSQGYAVGAVDYVFKPFHPEVLRAKVSAFVEISRKNQELRKEIERRHQAEGEVRTLNAELERRVAERTAELEKANRELLNENKVRRRAEQALREEQSKIEELNRRLQRAMTETHHRVKNNLQTIAAIVDMRLMDEEESIPAEEIHRLGSQIRTLAAVHDILTQEAKLDAQAHNLSVRSVLDKLIPMLQNTAPGREIVAKVDDVRLPARQGSSLALIVNELVSNALKYGEGKVEVSFKHRRDRAVLKVRDHGPGFAEDFNSHRSANTGLELVDGLARWDLNAATNYDNPRSGGALVTIEIPVAQPNGGGPDSVIG